MFSLGQKLKLIKTGQNRNDSTRTLGLVFTKKMAPKTGNIRKMKQF